MSTKLTGSDTGEAYAAGQAGVRVEACRICKSKGKNCGEDAKAVSHTLGPWKVIDLRGNLSVERVDANGAGVCAVIQPIGEDASEEDRANARLIAESPNLLAACEAMVEAMTTAYPNGLPVQQGTLCEEQDWNTSIRLARLAISRARGLA